MCPLDSHPENPQLVQALSEEDEVVRRLIAEIARGLVDNADAVRVEIVEYLCARTVKLHVAQSDFGKVVGKQGKTANGIRIILAATASRIHKR
jgi:uncharacterized protein